MPSDITGLLRLLELEEIEVGLFRGHQPQTLMQRAFGGQVLGQAVKAVASTVDEARQLHSLHSYFLLPGRTDIPMIYDTTVIRDGGSYSTRQVHARQGGRTIFTLTASFHVPEEGLDHSEQVDTEGLPAPDDCEDLADVFGRRHEGSREFWDAEWGALDMRFVDRQQIHNPRAPHPAKQRFWMRIDGDLPEDRGVHESMLAYMSDLTLLSASTVTHDDELEGKELSPASLDHSMWFHRPFRANDWLLYDQVSPSASRGNGLSLGMIYQNDVLVATVAQEGKIRVRTRD